MAISKAKSLLRNGPPAQVKVILADLRKMFSLKQKIIKLEAAHERSGVYDANIIKQITVLYEQSNGVINELVQRGVHYDVWYVFSD